MLGRSVLSHRWKLWGAVRAIANFTIAKYVTLKLLDVPIERIRLIYVRAKIGRPHSSSQAYGAWLCPRPANRSSWTI